jgi:hypothetical protein
VEDEFYAQYLCYGCQNLNCIYYCCLPSIIGVKVCIVGEEVDSFNFK